MDLAEHRAPPGFHHVGAQKSSVAPQIAFELRLAGGCAACVDGESVQPAHEFTGQKRIDAPVTFDPA